MIAAVIALILLASGPVESVPDASRHPDAPRIVAVGDLHGDLDGTRRVLRLVGAIDETDHWVGETLVLVQTGDQLDRGDQEQEVLDLLEALIVEAAAAGGAVHILNGNHELMNAALDLRYVTPGGYEDFEDAVDYDPADSTLAGFEPEHRARVAAFRPGGAYALRLARRSVILILGDNVFVHGGLLPSHLDYGVDRINSETRAWLRGERDRPEVLRGADSPVWSRHYSDEVDEDDCELLTGVLEALGVEAMVVGHTVQDDGIRSYCDGRVWAIDVGIAAHYGGPIQALEIVGDTIRPISEN